MIIPPIDPRIANGVVAGRRTTQARQTIASKVIITDAARSGAHVFQNPTEVSRTDTDGTILWDGNTPISFPRLTSPFLIGVGTTVSPIITGSQDIISPKEPTSSVEVRNEKPFHTSIHGNSAENWDPTPTFSKLTGREFSDDSSADIYLFCRVKFTHDAVITEIPNFMNLGLSAFHTSDELVSFSIPANRIGRPMNGSNCLLPVHIIGEVIASRMSRTRSEQNYCSKTDFETKR